MAIFILYSYHGRGDVFFTASQFFCNKYAPKKYVSLLMGVIAVSTFGANKLSPFVQAFIEKFDVFPVFVGIFALMLVFATLIWAANGKLNNLVEGEE